jgi:hypothetical protein
MKTALSGQQSALKVSIDFMAKYGNKDTVQRANAELAAKDEALSAAQRLIGHHGYVVVLNGGTGFKYLRCRECNGTNMSETSHEVNRFDVKHENGCLIAVIEGLR